MRVYMIKSVCKKQMFISRGRVILKGSGTYYIVDKCVLPEIIINVVKAKRLLKTGEAETINEAVSKAGISRSAFYKYKDFVSPFKEGSIGRIITVSFLLEDKPGILSSVINTIAEGGGNILTINQNIPLNGIASVTISVDTKNIEEMDTFLNALKSNNGVHKTDVIAKE